jgi:dihydrofolate reductase
MTEEQYREAYREAIRQAQEQARKAQIERVQAARRAAERQQMLDEAPRRKYAVIAAVDIHGGFAKDGQIPWHHPQDLKWFKNRTTGQICVMGRTTYEDINNRLDGKNATSALPDRRCFVVSSAVEELTNATAVKSIGEVEKHLTDDDLEKTIFFIGGERIFQEGIALADTAYITAINKAYNCDKFFPTKYLMEQFVTDKVYKHNEAPDVRFTIWKRRETA